MMRDTMEGTLCCSRLIPRRRVTKKNGLLGSLLLDAIQPLPPHDLFYVTNGLEGTENEQWTLRGKGAAGLRYEDRGRPVRVSGDLRSNPSYSGIGMPRRLGALLRVQVEFLDIG